jgi:hypothetical protein
MKKKKKKKKKRRKKTTTSGNVDIITHKSHYGQNRRI